MPISPEHYGPTGRKNLQQQSRGYLHPPFGQIWANGPLVVDFKERRHGLAQRGLETSGEN